MKFEATVKNLNAKGYEVTVFDTALKAAEYLNDKIDKKTVGFGGSMTLDKMNLYELLSSHNRVYWHWRPEDKTGKEAIAMANTAEVYLSSVNGLAETGEIINIDGNCNRVSSILYGHQKVYLIAGKNKLEKDYEGALYRARNVASPLNAKRLGINTPCAKNGDRCYDCDSPERICRGLSVLWASPNSAKFEVVLIDEELGY
jgi:hypothetical protein